MKAIPDMRSRSFLIDLGLVAVAIIHGYFALNLFERESDLMYAITLIGALGIFFRQSYPWATLLIAMPGLFITDAVVAPLVALYSLAVRGTDNRILFLIAAVVVFGYSAIWRGYPSVDLAVIISTYGLVGVIGAVATGMLVRTRRKLSESIEQVRVIRLEEIERVSRDVRSTERAELAREMHDAVSHQVSLIAVQAGALQVTASDEESARAGRVIRTLAVKTIEELRQMVTVLRASGARSQELTPQFTLGDINDLVTESGIEVDVRIEVPDELPPSIQRAVYRTVKEGLSNSAMYAPGAAVAVSCVATDGVMTLSVENGPSDESPVDVPSTQHGHIGLAERAELLGGSFEAGETASGYRIKLVVPLD